MAEPKRRPATYQDLIDLPEQQVGEIVDGDLHVSPRPAFPHANAEAAVSADLFNLFGRPPGGGGGGPGGWCILIEPELHLGPRPDVVVPNLAGWRRTRMPKVPNVASIDLAPDWLCEIISPATARFDRTKKMRVYARAEVAWLWLLDPLARTLEIFRREGELWTRTAAHADQEKVRADPFAEVELELSRWWLED